MVLLKNERNVLPLSTSLRRLAVIGPLADNQADLLGAWHADGKAAEVVTLLQGIKNKLGNTTDIRYVKGCEVTGNSQAGFEEAIAAARISDAVVVAVGEHEWMSGEAASRSDIRLPGVQLELVQALLRTGKPVVVVLMNGRPLAIPELAAQAPAILEAWFGGTEAGNAIADVLFGDYNPSGKLPITFPRSLGQVPLFYAAKPTGRPRDENNKYTSKYLDEANTPLYPFGYGLSYTTFAYGQAAIDKPSMKLNDSLQLTITVTNTGKRAGEETVQLYVRDKVGSVTRPLRELRDFQKIQLQAGESQQVTFVITAETLSFFRADMNYAPEAGEYILFVGSDSNASQSVTIRFE
jgi:beta-glucosidase